MRTANENLAEEQKIKQHENSTHNGGHGGAARH